MSDTTAQQPTTGDSTGTREDWEQALRGFLVDQEAEQERLTARDAVVRRLDAQRARRRRFIPPQVVRIR